MKLNILICVHSQDTLHDRLLTRALESLVAQTYDAFSVVVVLDECRPETESVVRAYKDVLDIRWFSRPKKSGLANAKNFGLTKCDSEWVAFLDADDAYHPEKLEKQVKFIEENPYIDVLATQASDVYDPSTDQEEIKDNCFVIGQYRTDTEIKMRLPYENVICHGSVMIRRELAHYNTSSSFKGQEDYALWTMLAGKCCLFYNIPERLYYYSMNTGVPR